jgi:NAD(P)H-hydrate epimerase
MIPHFKGNVPFIDSLKMQEVDRALKETYGIDQTSLIENAGLNAALLARNMLADQTNGGQKVLVIAGNGNNGACALVAARRLMAWGFEVSLMLVGSKSKIKKETKSQLHFLEKVGVPVRKSVSEMDLIIDGIFGYGLQGEPDKSSAKIIREINDSGIPVLSIDAPSGLNLTTGKPANPTVKATATMTLALPKTGLFKMAASKHVGALYLADVSIPAMILESQGIRTNGLSKAFHESTLVKINKVVVFSS